MSLKGKAEQFYNFETILRGLVDDGKVKQASFSTLNMRLKLTFGEALGGWW